MYSGYLPFDLLTQFIGVFNARISNLLSGFQESSLLSLVETLSLLLLRDPEMKLTTSPVILFLFSSLVCPSIVFNSSISPPSKY